MADGSQSPEYRGPRCCSKPPNIGLLTRLGRLGGVKGARARMLCLADPLPSSTLDRPQEPADLGVEPLRRL